MLHNDLVDVPHVLECRVLLDEVLEFPLPSPLKQL
jgi:hypothetical protein